MPLQIRLHSFCDFNLMFFGNPNRSKLFALIWSEIIILLYWSLNAHLSLGYATHKKRLIMLKSPLRGSKKYSNVCCWVTLLLGGQDHTGGAGYIYGLLHTWGLSGFLFKRRYIQILMSLMVGLPDSLRGLILKCVSTSKLLIPLKLKKKLGI